MTTFTSICLLALLSLVAGSPTGQHSIEKRQTTVTFNGKYEDIHQLITNLVVAFTFATAVVVVALPLFGYKLSLVTSALESTSPTEEDSVRSDPTGGAFTNYGAPPAYEGYARSLASSLVSSIDLVDAGLNFAGVEEQACRLRTICEVEQAAANNPFARLAINTINSNLSGLSKYQSAVEAGLGGQDCSLLYSQCPLSYARAFTSLL